MKEYIIGVDIGGTNTDAVIIDETNAIIAAHKTITTDPVALGFRSALERVLEQSVLKPAQINRLFVGTTHATNALLQAKDLYKVGIVRLAGNSGLSLPSCYEWPERLTKTMFIGSAQVDGGFQCDGRTITELDKEQIQKVLAEFKQQGMESLAVVGVYAPMNPEQEQCVKTWAHELLGDDFPVTLSHTIGGVGFIERENATILNAALKKSMQRGFSALQEVLQELGLNCPLYLTQNNGTSMSLQQALELPILTISSGPTNSFVGATKLAQLDNAIVVDIGGTSTDVGIVLDGFARRSVGSSSIGGITLNFSMPDVLSIALGGGSYVSFEDNKLTIGPESAGRLLFEHAQAFGGDRLTLIDVALKSGFVDISGAKPDAIKVDERNAQSVINNVEHQLLDLKSRIAGVRKQLPVVLVGGGAMLFKNSPIADAFIIPDFAQVANAYGAALAEISGTVDTVVSLDDREKIIEDLTAQATTLACNNGAQPGTTRVVNKQIVPFNYVPNNLARVKIMVAGKRK